MASRALRAGGCAIALVTGLIAAGCGDSAERDYAAQVDRVGQSLVRRANELNEASNGASSAPKVASAFSELSRAAKQKADELRRIAPPAGVEAAHAELVAALRSFSGAASAAAAAVRAEDRRALMQARRELAPDGPALSRINVAITEVNRALD
jgi:hypothetical protein